MNLLYTTAITKSAEDRTIEAWASRGDIVDRDSEIILAKAWQHNDSLVDFLRAPALCAFHDYHQLPLGKIVDIDATNQGLRFKAVFAKTAAGEEALNFVKSTGLASFSVGFMPISFSDFSIEKVSKMGFDVSGASKDTIRIYDHCKLLEVSLVSVASNPYCTVIGQAYERGEIKEKSLQAALGVWKNGRSSNHVDEKQEIIAEVRRILAPKISEAVGSELERQGLFLKTAIRQAQLEILKKLGRVVPEDEEEQIVERHWPGIAEVKAPLIDPDITARITRSLLDSIQLEKNTR